MRFSKGHFEEEKLKKGLDLKLAAKLWPFVRPYRKWIFGAVFLAMSGSAIEVSIPLITKYALDHYISPDKSSVSFFSPETAFAGIFVAGCLLLASSVLNFAISFIQIQIMEYGGQRILNDLRVKLYSHIQGMPVEFFSKNPVGRLVTRVTSDIDNMLEMFTTVLVFFFRDFFMMAGITAVLLALNARLAVAAFTVMPFVFFSARYFGSRTRQVSRRLRTKTSQLNTAVAETLGGAAVIQAFRQEKYSLESFNSLNHEAYLDGMREIRIFGVFMPVIEFLSSVGLVIVIFYGGLAVKDLEITIGALVAYISYLKMFFRPVRDIIEKYNITQNALASAERVFQILETESAMPVNAGEMAAETRLLPFESLEFKKIWFAYEPGIYALKNISFKLEKGRTIAAVGHTGAGKTTVISLLLKFYNPEKGEILVNGRNLDETGAVEIRKRTALVTQDPFIFSGSVRENVTCLKNNMDDDGIMKILEAAQCLDFVNGLPDGIDSVLGEGGLKLSSGQRQLLSIARAIAADPEVIIFDEATSYVDSETEKRLKYAIENLASGRSVIMIAHRISTAKSADEILVFHKGSIVERGIHEELLRKKGFYWRLNSLEGA